MRKLKKKEKILSTLAIATVIGLGLSNSNVTLPQMKGSQVLDREIQIKKRMLASNLDLLKQKNKIKEEIVFFSKLLRKQRTQEEETVDFIGELEDLAKGTKVELVDMKPFTPLKSSKYVEYKVEIEAEATITDVSRFIYKIQNSQNLLRVIKFRISPKTDTQDILRIYLTVTKIFLS